MEEKCCSNVKKARRVGMASKLPSRCDALESLASSSLALDGLKHLRCGLELGLGDLPMLDVAQFSYSFLIGSPEQITPCLLT